MEIRFLLIGAMIFLINACQLPLKSNREKELSDSVVVSTNELGASSVATPLGGQNEHKNDKTLQTESNINQLEYITYKDSKEDLENNIVTFVYDSLEIALEHRWNEYEGNQNIIYRQKNTLISKIFLLEDYFDMGDFDLWFFRGRNSNIIIIELYDYYASVFFAYVLVNEKLYKIGDFAVFEPEVEEVGPKKKSVEVVLDGERYITTTFLGGVEDGVFEFEWADAIEQKIIN